MKIIQTKEHQIIVDDCVYDNVIQYNWVVYKATKTNVHYAKAKLCRHYAAPIFLHRYVGHLLNGWPTKGDRMHIDHINGNGLDCRIENLRYVTPRENILKSKPLCKPSSTGCKGVYLIRHTGKYAAEYFKDYKKYYIGSYPTIELAVEARNAFINKLNLGHE